MKKTFAVAFFLMMAIAFQQMAMSEPVITNVTAQQRYPWNGKVDILYTVSGDISVTAKEQGLITSLKVTATDNLSKQTFTAISLSGDIALSDGTHGIVWDMTADGLTFVSSNVVFSVSCETTPATYCVIDLSNGASALSYPVTYLASPPAGGFNVDAYKTTKLVLKRIEAGSFILGSDQTDESHRVTLTKDFFVGIFEVTQKQYSLVMGSNPSQFLSDRLPVEKVSFDIIRGSSDGALWPASNAVDTSSFLGKLRTKTELDFDLPTRAQWEYACRAGTTTTFSYGDDPNGDYMWYGPNASSQTHDVGTKLANPWGLYDMYGNVWEWCLDWNYKIGYGTDPKGSLSGTGRITHGGSYGDHYSLSSFRVEAMPSSVVSSKGGFRLARTITE